MNGDVPHADDRAARLRAEFDAGFAQPPPSRRAGSIALLALVIGGDRYALRLSEVSGLYADRKIVPLPTPLPELLGVAGFRSAAVPVYDLRAFLGYPPGRMPRWLVMAAAQAPIAFAFDGFEGYLQVPEQALAPVPDAAGGTRHVRESVRTAAATAGIVHLASVLQAIQTRGRERVPATGSRRTW